MKYIQKDKQKVVAGDLVVGDWIKVGGNLFRIKSRVKHQRNVELSCVVGDSDFMVLFVPYGLGFNVYYPHVKLKQDG